MTGDSVKAGATAEKKSFGQKCNERCHNLRKFIWNGETKEFMGRTGSNWAKIGLFYLIFYGFLAGFFAAMLAIFLSTLNPVDGEGGPTLTQFIKNQPGLTRLDQTNGRLPTSYNISDTKLQERYRDLVKNFLKGYNDTNFYSNDTCDPANLSGTPAGKKPCRFNTSLLADCSGDTDSTFGLAKGRPCIFIRINKVFNWVPEPPIAGSNYLHLECTGDAIVRPKGFLISAFPFRGQKGYQPPIVSVQVNATSSASDIECHLVGKDISVSSSSLPERAFGKIKLEKITSQS